ncbi:hypothetical protein MRX96_041370 [Rhipicephalus microplus]
MMAIPPGLAPPQASYLAREIKASQSAPGSPGGAHHLGGSPLMPAFTNSKPKVCRCCFYASPLGTILPWSQRPCFFELAVRV